MSTTGGADASALVALAGSLVAHECAQGDVSERTAVTRTIAKMFFELVPLIGSAGVLALFARSVLKAKARCKPLDALVITVESIDAACSELERRFAAIPTADVIDAGTTLSASFLALVSTFIGERLTLQLLQNAWPMIALVKEPK
jgi:hypothetical protein